MNYPLISEYIDSIISADDNFEKLSYLQPVVGNDGLPIMTSGNFAVIFKMEDKRNGKLYALKCFTKEQEGRDENYILIENELEEINSPYLVTFKYFKKELFVDTHQTIETEFPVLLMDWVEGMNLDNYIRSNLNNNFVLEKLAYDFCKMSAWLYAQPFAHGDLKPDNILVRADGSIVIIDYDGMYVSSMRGQKAKEVGSPNFRHPLRTEIDFNERIDDFSLILISLSLKALSIEPDLLLEANSEGLLLSESDYVDLSKSRIFKRLLNIEGDWDYYKLLGEFLVCINNINFIDTNLKLFNVKKYKKDRQDNVIYNYFTDTRDNYTYKTIKIGNQVWLAENLKYLPQIGNGFYVYGYKGNKINEAKNTANFNKYGVLYNIAAAKKACPKGWHLPTDEEWKELEFYLKSTKENISKNNVGSILISKDAELNDGALFNNKVADIGFNAHLAGWRTYHGEFTGIYKICRWWTNTIENKNKDDGSEYNYKFYKYSKLDYRISDIEYDNCAELCCLSLRCVKD